jgi:hypothetical protein
VKKLIIAGLLLGAVYPAHANDLLTGYSDSEVCTQLKLVAKKINETDGESSIDANGTFEGIMVLCSAKLMVYQKRTTLDKTELDEGWQTAIQARFTSQMCLEGLIRAMQKRGWSTLEQWTFANGDVYRNVALKCPEVTS